MLSRFQKHGGRGRNSLDRVGGENLAAQEAFHRGLQDLTEAKRCQEDALMTLRQGLTAAKDEDTIRLEAG